MIEIALNQVIKTFGYKTVLNGASLEVKTKERVSIIGANGSGKTTIFRIIARAESIDHGLVTIRKDASIGFLEQIPQPEAKGTTVRQVLMASFSELTEIENKMKVLEGRMSETDPENTANLEKVMKEYGRLQTRYAALDGYAMEEEMGRVISGFRLEPLLEREFNVLSGGQKTIVKLAALLLEKPDIVFLDEPTNHLDVETLEWLEGFLLKYHGTVVLISHDRYFLDKVVTKTILLEDGECQSFNGNYSYCLQEQERLLVLEFEAYKNQQKRIAAMKEAIKRFREWGARGNNKRLFRKAFDLEKKLARLELIGKPKEKKALPVQFAGERSGKDVLTIRDLDILLGETVLFEQANANIYYRDRVCLFGSNGSGKTTLIRAILGYIEPLSGKIKLGENTKLGYIPQEIRFADEEATVLQAFREQITTSEGAAQDIFGYGLCRLFYVGEGFCYCK